MAESVTARPLTPEQATQDALTALKAAGFGKEHGWPVKVQSHSLGPAATAPFRTLIVTRATVSKAAHLDEAIRALIVLPDATGCAFKGREVTVYRDANPQPAPVNDSAATAAPREDEGP